MKIISKETRTTVIFDDGTHSDMIKKIVTVKDDSFECVNLDDMHEAIVTALRDVIKN